MSPPPRKLRAVSRQVNSDSQTASIGRRLLGYAPATVAAVACAALFLANGVTIGDLTIFVAFVALIIVAPGLLVWRALGARFAGENLSMGAALGLAIVVISYLPARAAGVPLAFLLGPLAILVVFCAAPTLRRHLRPPSGEPTPLWYSTTVALLAVGVVAWLAYRGWLTHPLDDSLVARQPYLDLPYHLALSAELANHWPPTVPYVAGEPLHYHWFAHAFVAATSTGTGLDIPLVLLRFLTPMTVIITIALTARTAWILSGRAAAGPLAIVLAFVLGTVSPYGWDDTLGFFDTRALDDWWWQSPSQAFGAAVFAATMLVLIAAWRAPRPSNWLWITYAGLCIVLVGAKGTFVPLLLGGAVCVLALSRLLTKRLDRVALMAAAISAFVLALALVVLYGGQSDGMELRPLSNLAKLPVTADTGIRPVATWLYAVLAVLVLASWLPRFTGVLGWLRYPGAVAAEQWLVICCAGVGVAATLAFAHQGFSEYYFLRSVLPLAAVCGAAGLVAAFAPAASGMSGWSRLDRPQQVAAGNTLATDVTEVDTAAATATPPAAHGNAAADSQADSGATSPAGPRDWVWIVAVATSLGALAVAASRQLTATIPNGSDLQVAWALLLPFVVLGLVAAVVWFVLYRSRWRQLALAAICCFLVGATLPGTAQFFDDFRRQLELTGWNAYVGPGVGAPQPAGSHTAMRWLADHANIDDVVATNAHCRNGGPVGQPGGCDNRSFWVAALSERRVLVEGWGYRDTTAVSRDGTVFSHLPFDDPGLLVLNDSMFTTPSAAVADALRARGVRWLVVDERIPTSPALADFATLRYRTGEVAIYQL